MKLKDIIVGMIKVMLQLLFVWIILQIANLLSLQMESIIKIPASIIGMLLLLTLLLTGIIKVDYLKESGEFLLKHMGFFFVPLGVSLMNAFDLLKDTWLALLIILILSVMTVMFTSSKMTDVLISYKSKEVK